EKEDDAWKALQEVVSVYEKMIASDVDVPRFRRMVTRVYLMRGLLRSITDHSLEAEQDFDKVVTMLEKLVKEHPGVPLFLDALSHAHARILQLYQELDNTEGQLRHLQALLPILDRLTRDYPLCLKYQYHRAQIYGSLGDLKERREAFEEAETAYRTAIRL